MNINIKTPILAALTLVTTESAKALNNSTLTTPVPKTEVVDNKTNSTEQHSQYFLQANRNQTVLADSGRQSVNQFVTPARFAALFGTNLTVGTDISHLIHSPLLGGQSVIQLDNVDVHVQEREGRRIISNLTAPVQPSVTAPVQSSVTPPPRVLRSPEEIEALFPGAISRWTYDPAGARRLQMIEGKFQVLKDLRIKYPEFRLNNRIAKSIENMLIMKEDGRITHADIKLYIRESTTVPIIKKITDDNRADSRIPYNFLDHNFITHLYVTLLFTDMNGEENSLTIHQNEGYNGAIVYVHEYRPLSGKTEIEDDLADYSSRRTPAYETVMTIASSGRE